MSALGGQVMAKNAVPKALTDWQTANQVWQQANIDFQKAGRAYIEAGARYRNIISKAPDQNTLAKALTDWHRANQKWQQANIDFQKAGRTFLDAGAVFTAKSVPIYNSVGRYVIKQPSTIPVVVVNNGSVVHLKDLPMPFDKLVPSGQGPGKFTYNWVYADKIYGYAYLVIDNSGSGKVVFEFTNGAGNTNPSYSSVTLTPLDSQGNKLAIFGITTYTHSVGGSRFYYRVSEGIRFLVGGQPNHGHAHHVDVVEPTEWWSKVHSLKIEWTQGSQPKALEWLAKKVAGLPKNRIYIAK